VIFNATLDNQLAGLHAPPELVAAIVTQRQKLAGIEIPNGYPQATTAALKHAVGVSFVAGFRWVMLISAGLALLSAISAWWLIEGKAAASKVADPA
jgi:hypothetical protein